MITTGKKLFLLLSIFSTRTTATARIGGGPPVGYWDGVQYAPLGGNTSRTSNHQKHALQYSIGPPAYVQQFSSLIMNLLALNLNIFIFLEYVDGRIGCRGRMFYSLVDRAWICVILPSGIREPAKTGQWTRLMEYSESCPKVEIENFPKSENVRLEK